MLFFLFLDKRLIFKKIGAVIAQIFNPDAELAIPTRIKTN